MIKCKWDTITTSIYKPVPISGSCDVCGKELLPIDKGKYTSYASYIDYDLYDYYRITTHHHDWGNDSMDSYEYKDCCCLDCALKFINKYWDGCTDKNPWPTLELEMKHMHRLEEG